MADTFGGLADINENIANKRNQVAFIDDYISKAKELNTLSSSFTEPLGET